jgi:DNA-binding beta-propeller fold protein YncE
LIRVWGGAEEEDENKFFNTPTSVVVDDNQFVYICDRHNHCIKVFNNTGNYVRTIGRKGRGPGDLYSPTYITFSPGGALLVNESGGRRIQWFNSQGKSKQILKHIETISWIGVISKNELAVYSDYKTFYNRKLISIIDNKGKHLREIGKYHDNAKRLIESERLYFAIDEGGNIYAANTGTPVIRKYSPGGRLKMVITFDTTFEIPVEITLNSSGDEIQRKEEIDSQEDARIVGTDSGVSIQYNKRKRKWQYGICLGIGLDSQNRIYIVKRRRILKENESLATVISGNDIRINRERVNYDIVEKNDFNHILVFDSNGKIIAESPMTTLCDDIYISNNRIFVIDGLCNQRILEYEMIFQKGAANPTACTAWPFSHVKDGLSNPCFFSKLFQGMVKIIQEFQNECKCHG